MNLEKEINLAVLQQRDPYITSISDSASQVAIYSFNSDNNEWEKTHVEGTLFVYNRSAYPLNGFMVINRLDPRDLIEPIDQNLEFQLQGHFLLYRNAKGNIIGIWFYDEKECIKIDKLLNSLVRTSVRHSQHSEVVRPKGSSESEQTVERLDPPTSVSSSDANIMQMLFKAQNEYEKVKSQTSIRKTNNIQNGNSSMKLSNSNENNSRSDLTQSNLESLFQKLSMQHNSSKVYQNPGKKLKNHEITQQVSINESLKTNLSFNDLMLNQSPDPKNKFQNTSQKSTKLTSSTCNSMLNENALIENNPVLDTKDSLNLFHINQPPSHIPASSNSFQPRKTSPATVIQQLTHNHLPSQNNKFHIASLSDNVFKENVLSSLSRINTDPENSLQKPIGYISNLNTPIANVEQARSNISHSLMSSGQKSETLNGPDKYLSSSNMNDSLVSGNLLLSPMVFQSLPANKKTKNISPNLIEESSKTVKSTNDQNDKVDPLTKQQFQLALINLLKNDSNFLSRLHEAYIGCLNAELVERN